MGWLPIDKLLTHATVKLAHQIMQTSIPEVLSYKIKSKINSGQNPTRLTGPGKFGPRPKEFGKTQITKYQFKSNLFLQYPKIHEKILQIKNKKDLDYGQKSTSRTKIKYRRNNLMTKCNFLVIKLSPVSLLKIWIHYKITKYNTLPGSRTYTVPQLHSQSNEVVSYRLKSQID